MSGDLSTRRYPTKHVLELACAAQRINKSYLKVSEPVYDAEGQYVALKNSNKDCMLYTLDHMYHRGAPQDAPVMLKILEEDIAQADAIKSHFRKLLFSAIEGENEFLTSINSILNSEEVPVNQFGYVACLPSVYLRDYSQTQVKKAAKRVSEDYLAEVGDTLHDLDCEILECVKSKNFEGYNICATIDNKMASWMSKYELKLGPAVLVKAKVKEHAKHWKHGNAQTRLNYVKAAQ